MFFWRVDEWIVAILVNRDKLREMNNILVSWKISPEGVFFGGKLLFTEAVVSV